MSCWLIDESLVEHVGLVSTGAKIVTYVETAMIVAPIAVREATVAEVVVVENSRSYVDKVKAS